MKRGGRAKRREVVEAYARYDRMKKGCPVPDFDGWNWASANAIDREMRVSCLKEGVPAGYREWERVQMTVDDLRRCAVVDGISRKLKARHRDLGTLERSGALDNWMPRLPEPAWYLAIAAGRPLGAEEPLLLRPATRGEYPAEWYIEDGSGRATALVKHATSFASDQFVAHGYLGVTPDRTSTFMSTKLPELLDAGDNA